jgi:hypothetical protein
MKYDAFQCSTMYNVAQISTYLLILGYFIFQRALQANRFAFELIKGLRHVYVVVFVVAYRCFVGIVVIAIIAVVARRRTCLALALALGSSRHGPTMTEGSVKGRNVGVFLYFFFFRIRQLVGQSVRNSFLSLPSLFR